MVTRKTSTKAQTPPLLVMGAMIKTNLFKYFWNPDRDVDHQQNVFRFSLCSSISLLSIGIFIFSH